MVAEEWKTELGKEKKKEGSEEKPKLKEESDPILHTRGNTRGVEAAHWVGEAGGRDQNTAGSEASRLESSRVSSKGRINSSPIWWTAMTALFICLNAAAFLPTTFQHLLTGRVLRSKWNREKTKSLKPKLAVGLF